MMDFGFYFYDKSFTYLAYKNVFNIGLSCPVPSFEQKWGRVDVSDCSTSEPKLPNARMNATEMYDYFDKHFRFNKSQGSEKSTPKPSVLFTCT
jgi:hypothetical protein